MTTREKNTTTYYYCKQMNNANETLSPKPWYNAICVLQVTYDRLDFGTTVLEDLMKGLGHGLGLGVFPAH
jgi:hypothetical protein